MARWTWADLNMPNGDARRDTHKCRQISPEAADASVRAGFMLAPQNGRFDADEESRKATDRETGEARGRGDEEYATPVDTSATKSRKPSWRSARRTVTQCAAARSTDALLRYARITRGCQRHVACVVAGRRIRMYRRYHGLTDSSLHLWCTSIRS
jgi:hypothetical protein